MNVTTRPNPFKTGTWIRAGWVALLGLVGAGGIGMALDTALNLFQWDRVAMVLFAIFMVVIVAEIAVTYIRKHLI